MISLNEIKKLLKNKKAQAITSAQEVTTMFIISLCAYALMTFGMLQLFSYMYAPFRNLSTSIVMNWFGGYNLIFLFIAAGFIGLACNEVFGRMLQPVTGLKLIEKRTVVFFVIGGLCLAMGVIVTSLGNAGLISQSAIQSMILP